MIQSLYLRIADELRRQIINGDLASGARVPSRSQLARQHGVSDRVAWEALRLLAAEGYVETRPGSGTYVRHRPPVRRLSRSWYREARGGSPFRADMEAQGKTGSWDAASEVITATVAVADRLQIAPGDQVMQTRYVFKGDNTPVMLSTSWEPLAITAGTPILYPEDGPHAGRGVVERMQAIGVSITYAIEVVTARPLLSEEATLLAASKGTLTLVVQRTYYADTGPVETADIIIPTDRYELAYTIPIDTS